MAIVNAAPGANQNTVINLASALAGSVDTNVADRGPSHKVNATKVRITPVIGATPTCTYTINVSADGVSFVAATYADVSTPSTDVLGTAITLTTGVVVEKIIKHTVPAGGWRYIKVTMSANTNVSNTVDLIVNDGKRWV